MSDTRAASISMSSPLLKGKDLLHKAYATEVKEFHFHVYFFQANPVAMEAARQFRAQILELASLGYFRVQCSKTRTGHEINEVPRGPHTVGSFEVWCPREDFSRCFSWFALNHGSFSVLVHTVTREEVKDHTTRATWFGQPVPLDISVLPEDLGRSPAQYPEIGLGYSAKEE